MQKCINDEDEFLLERLATESFSRLVKSAVFFETLKKR